MTRQEIDCAQALDQVFEFIDQELEEGRFEAPALVSMIIDTHERNRRLPGKMDRGASEAIPNGVCRLPGSELGLVLHDDVAARLSRIKAFPRGRRSLLRIDGPF